MMIERQEKQMLNLVNKHNKIWEWHDVIDNLKELNNMLDKKKFESYTNKLPRDKKSNVKYGGGSILGRSVLVFPGEKSYDIILDSFIKCFENYCKENNLDLTSENISKDTFLLREYLPGSDMLAHPDAYSYVKKDDVQARPLFTIILYLNEDYEGGEINFINDGLKIKPKSGSGVMFPSEKVHEVLKVRSGVRQMVQTYVNEFERSYYDQESISSKY